MRGLIRIIVAAAAATVALLVPVAGKAGGSPSIAWTSPPNSGTYDYGAVTPGQTASQTFTLTNSGGSATGMLSVSLSGSSAFSITSDACTGTALGKGRSCAVTIQYEPTTAGQSDSATLTASGKKPSASASITLTGSGAGTEDLTLSPGLSWGPPLAARRTTTTPTSPSIWSTTFTVTNGGTGTSNMLTLAGCCDPQFVLANDTCSGKTLAPSATCTFDLSFTAPADCNPGEPFDTPLAVNAQDNGTPYIFLVAHGFCPFS